MKLFISLVKSNKRSIYDKKRNKIDLYKIRMTRIECIEIIFLSQIVKTKHIICYRI